METFENAVKTFLDKASWLTDLDQPMVIALKAAAKELDQGVQASLLNQYRQAYLALVESRPTGGMSDDDAYIEGLGKQTMVADDVHETA